MATGFVPYGPPHIIVISVTAVLILAVVLFRKKLRNRKRDRGLRYFISIVLLSLQLSYQLYHISRGIWSVRSELPVHLSDITVFVCALALITERKLFFELSYFWGVAGGTQALLTPGLVYGYPDPVFFIFFISHGLVLIACVYMTVVQRMRPDFKSIWKALAATNVAAVLAAMVNIITGGNYMFLCRKPPNPSMMDLLAEWPWYVLQLEVIAAFLFLLCYMPFAFKRDLRISS